MAAAANAQVSNNSCSDDAYDANINNPNINTCQSVPTAGGNAPSNPPGADRTGATLFIYLDAFATFPANLVHVYFWMRNDSGEDIVFARDDGYLYPQDADFPRLPLSALSAERVTLAAGLDSQFTLTMADPDDIITSDRLSAGGVRYYSMPAGGDACPHGFANAQMSDCNPPPPMCEGGTVNSDNMCECTNPALPKLENGRCVAEPDDPGNGELPGNPGNGGDQRTSTPPQRGDHDYVPAIAGGVGILLLAGWQILTDGGGVDNFSFSPDFGYAITESGYSYKYGGRVDFRKDAWSLYWTAGQRNANGEFGDFRYESGGEYDGGFWKAAFSESVRGDITDYDFSLSADWNGGIWRVSPEFFADARYKNGEFAMTNSFRISGELRVDDWRLSASGNAERVRLSAARRF